MRSAGLVLLALFLAPASAGAAAGDVDRRFGKDGVALVSLREASTQARAIAVQPDGKVIVTGTGAKGWVVTRLLRSGRPDPSFGRRGRVILASGEPAAIELMPDGRIVVGGTPFYDGNAGRVFVARLLPDGRRDGTWGEFGVATLQARGRLLFGAMALQPDGGVAVASSMHGDDQKLVVMRLGPGGRPDTGFGDDGAYVEPGYAAGNALVSRPGGGLIVGGQAGSYYVEPQRELLVALTEAGRVDTSWGQNGRLVGPSRSEVRWLEPAPGGGVVALENLHGQEALLWLRADGSRREDWGLEGRATAAAAGYWASRHAVDSTGQVYVTATVDASFGSLRTLPTLARVDAAGVPDFAFGGGVRARMPVRKPLVRAIGEDVAVAPDQRVYVAASGSDGFADDREDYGYTHAAVAAFKGWDQLVTLHSPAVTRVRGRLAVTGRCRGQSRCRIRLEARDRRGRRVARGSFTRRGPFEHRFALTPSRRLRAGERLTLRAVATNTAGQTDTDRERYTVPRRRR